MKNETTSNQAAKKFRPHAIWVGVCMAFGAWGVSNASSPKVEFNESMLTGGLKRADIEKFTKGNPVVPGRYRVDYYLNDTWQRRLDVTVRADQDIYTEKVCVDKAMLQGVPVDVKKLAPANSEKYLRIRTGAFDPESSCDSLEDIFPGVKVKLDIAQLRFDVGIPQILLSKNPLGYVPQELWEDGIPALTVSYSLDSYQAKYGATSSSTSFGSIDAGASWGRWRFRHRGNFAVGQIYDSSGAYAYTDIPEISGKLLIGSTSTLGRDYGSIPVLGLHLFSDSRMQPASQQGYAPTIRGQAKTNARVTVTQRGNLVYQTTVPAGPFEISDMYSNGSGGEYLVRIFEADGTESSFTVNYFATPDTLRLGAFNYGLSAGNYDAKGARTDYQVVQASASYGLLDSLSLTGGLLTSEGYNLADLGVSFGTPIGAWSFSAVSSDLRLPGDRSREGSSLRASFATVIPTTLTNFSVASYQSNSENFYAAGDALPLLTGQRAANFSNGGAKNQLSVALNQSLGRFGSIYASATRSSFSGSIATQTSYQAGWNRSIGTANLSLSATRQITNGIEGLSYSLQLTMPLGSGPRPAMLLAGVDTTEGGGTRSNVGLSGTVDGIDNLNYAIRTASDDGKNVSSSGNVNWSSGYGTMSGSVSQSTSGNAVSAGFRGGLLVHQDGVVLAPQLGETVTLIKAENAAGAEIVGSGFSRINKSGYGVMPFVSPYARNSVELDTRNLATDVDVASATQVTVPKAGAVSMVEFKTEVSKLVVIKIEGPLSDQISFGAPITDATGQIVGMVGQGGKVQARVKAASGLLYGTLSDDAKTAFQVAYQVPVEAKSGLANIVAIALPKATERTALLDPSVLGKESKADWIRSSGVIHFPTGEPIPRGANITADRPDMGSTSSVGKDGSFMLRLDKSVNVLTVSWGDGPQERCSSVISNPTTSNLVLICRSDAPYAVGPINTISSGK